ncbi:MAG: biotin-dependent carboxyltransferase family protein [Xanthobacteraceae bacterium]|nr:biotin-dependent carboxyltransferase family protein [Xanthobacteraceae bacterium]
MSRLIVTAVGPATSVQDAGRFGAQRYGLPPSGAMDRLALATANTLAGNPPFTAAIELGPYGATFTAEDGPVRIALAGAARGIKIDDRVLPRNQSATLQPGERLTLGAAREAVFSYLAVEGGISGEAAFGSRSVNARAGLGSPVARPLQSGDRLDVDPATERAEQTIASLPIAPDPIRVVLGPQDDEFGDAVRTFLDGVWTISPTSDRMGYRLEGPLIRHRNGHNIVSDGTVNGSIQVPGNGQPIVLMPDRGTTGGYPKIATVIGPDLGRFAQTPPRRPFRFEAISVAEARQAAIAFAARLADLPARMTAVGQFEVNVAALHSANIAGHAVSAVDAGTWQSEPRPDQRP